MNRHIPVHLGRPVRVPSENESRLAWARDVSRDNESELGINWEKVKLVLKLPLFEVLVWGGMEGIVEAERLAHQQQRRAA